MDLVIDDRDSLLARIARLENEMRKSRLRQMTAYELFVPSTGRVAYRYRQTLAFVPTIEQAKAFVKEHGAYTSFGKVHLVNVNGALYRRLATPLSAQHTEMLLDPVDEKVFQQKRKVYAILKSSSCWKHGLPHCSVRASVLRRGLWFR